MLTRSLPMLLLLTGKKFAYHSAYYIHAGFVVLVCEWRASVHARPVCIACILNHACKFGSADISQSTVPQSRQAHQLWFVFCSLQYDGADKRKKKGKWWKRCLVGGALAGAGLLLAASRHQ